jgi:outer membrane protein assembly factor BamE
MQNCLQLFTRLLNFIFRVFDLARLGLVIAAVSSAMIAVGCTSAVDDTQRAWMNKVFRPYVPDVVQGNFISSEQYAKLQVGQSREQVRQILGTPLLASYFHANRWDYVFEYKRAGQQMSKERRVTVFFEGDKLVKFQGDALPTNVELVAEIDGYAKTKRSFWDVMTGSNKPPVTPPLQQPELLVPSPTNNLPAGATVPAAPASSAFWDFFGFSKKSSDAQPVRQQRGPGELMVAQVSEVK